MKPNGETVVDPSSTTSFLTEAQRSALDAALAAKQSSAAAKAIAQGSAAGATGASHHKPLASNERKSRNTKGTGAVKKGGAGGKFTWGSALQDGDEAVESLDRNDPNYDSEEERSVVFQADNSNNEALKAEIRAYKEEVSRIVEEYFSAGDVGDAAASLVEMGAPELSHYFVKRLVTLALDRKDREREMASVLLSSLYAEVIPAEQAHKGLVRVMDSVDDLALDVPTAVELVALFVARAVVDDVLPPAVPGRITAPEGSQLAELKRRIELHLSARHSAERLLRCWGGAGAGQSWASTKESIATLLREFEASHDAEEASRCLRKLDVAFFHHELVKQAVHSAMSNPAQQASLVALLARLADTGEVSASQLSKGLKRVADGLDDVALDNPAARSQFGTVMDAAKEAGLLDAEALAALQASSSAADPTSPQSVGGGSSVSGYAHGVAAFKAAAQAAIREYFDSADATEVSRRLTELDDPGLHHIFIKQAVMLALDRKDRERELVSSLLGSLSPTMLTPDQLSMGFTRLLAAVDDAVLDIPDAVHLTSLFLGRAIVDEVLPPSFLASVLPALPDGSLSVAVVQATGAMLSARHAAERLQSCWKGGSLTLEDIKLQMRAALQEFVVSKNAVEASQLLRELDVPHYHHEFVKEAIEAAFETPAAAPALMSLLAQLGSSGVVNETQMRQGFERISTRLDDELLDYPAARDQFAEFSKRAHSEGWLPAASA